MVQSVGRTGVCWDNAGLSSFLCGVSGSCCWVETSGVGDGERVKRSFPALGPGAEFTSSVVSDIADGQVEDLQNGIVGGEMPAGFGDFAELIVQQLDSVGGVDDLADRSVEGQERREPFPVTSPQINDRWIHVAPLGLEMVEGVGSGVDVRRLVDGFERFGDGLAVLP